MKVWSVDENFMERTLTHGMIMRSDERMMIKHLDLVVWVWMPKVCDQTCQKENWVEDYVLFKTFCDFTRSANIIVIIPWQSRIKQLNSIGATPKSIRISNTLFTLLRNNTKKKKLERTLWDVGF